MFPHASVHTISHTENILFFPSTLPVQFFLQQNLRRRMKAVEDMFWIGLRDTQEEGTWLWEDGSPLKDRFDCCEHICDCLFPKMKVTRCFFKTSPSCSPSLSLTFWGYNQPDDWQGEDDDGEDCVRMGEKAESSNLNSWFDRSCKIPHKSVCEKAAETGHLLCAWNVVQSWTSASWSFMNLLRDLNR